MTEENDNPLGLEPDGEPDSFDYNLPLQWWPDDPEDDETGDDDADAEPAVPGIGRIVNYMARRSRCEDYEPEIEPAQVPAFCRNTARVLRNLADLFDAKAAGKIDMIYYPDEPVADAIAKAAKDRAKGTP